MDKGRNSAVSNKPSDENQQMENRETELNTTEVLLLSLFRMLSLANQKNILRCVEVLHKAQKDE